MDPDALLLRADALGALGRGAEAVPIFRRVLEVAPSSVGARLGLGRALLAVDAAEAERQFVAVLAADPKNAAAANNLGIARDLQNRHAEAQLAYRRALTMAPAMQAAAVNLALSLGLSGQTAEAIPLLRPLAQAPGAAVKVRHDMAAVLAMAGERGSAAQMLAVDLPDREVQQALGVFSALRPGARPTVDARDPAL
jgi:Flp pilus assembly protein TadD